MRHGSRGYPLDAEGVLRFKRMPLGIAAVLQVSIEDSQYGALEQRFEIPEVREETITLRVTGAGTVVVRLHPKGAPQEPLTVRHGYVVEHECHGIAHEDGPACELRGRTSPGLYPSLKAGAKGFRERVIENVQVSDDGPTFLDVELEPR